MPMMGWGYNGTGPWNYGYGGWDPFSLVWGFFWAVIGIIVIVAILRAIAGGRRRRWRERVDDNDSALKILKERYAKGEINRQEFEEKKKDLAA